MLSAWENHYHRNDHRFEIRFRRAFLKLNRWWIFYRYNGNPNNNPLLLTSRPKNLPLISLRSEEFSEFISKNDYVNKKWDQFWQPIPSIDYQINEDVKKSKRQPLREINLKNQPKRRKQKNGNRETFKIYEDPKIVQRNNDNNDNISVVNNFTMESNGSLDSFEKHLLESVNLTYSRVGYLLPFAESKKSINGLKTPNYYDTYCQRGQGNGDNDDQQDNHMRDQENQSISLDEPFENKKIQVINSNNFTNDINLNNVFENDRNDDDDDIFNNMEFTKKNIKRKTKYKALGFDGDRIAIQKQMTSHGLRGWISNKVRPETRSTFDNNNNNNRVTLNSNPIGGQLIRTQRFTNIPLIQRPEFFNRNLLVSRNSQISSNEMERLREYQVKNYVRPDKINREKRREISKRLINSRNSEQERVVSIFKKLKNNTKKMIQYNPSENNNNVKKPSHDDEPRKHNWNIFSSFMSKRKPVIEETANLGDYNNNNNNTSNQRGTKRVTIFTSKLHAVNEPESGEVFEDEYDIFASYDYDQDT